MIGWAVRTRAIVYCGTCDVPKFNINAYFLDTLGTNSANTNTYINYDVIGIHETALSILNLPRKALQSYFCLRFPSEGEFSPDALIGSMCAAIATVLDYYSVCYRHLCYDPNGVNRFSKSPDEISICSSKYFCVQIFDLENTFLQRVPLRGSRV